MTTTKTSNGNSYIDVGNPTKTMVRGITGQGYLYFKLSGTEGQVLQALADEKIQKEQIVGMASDNTWVVYYKKV